MQNTFDVNLFDATVNDIQSRDPEKRQQAEVLLRNFKNDPSSYMYIDIVLRESKSIASKQLIIKLFQETVKKTWMLIPADQRKSIKDYLTEIVLRYAVAARTEKDGEFVVNCLNMVVVEIIKQEWPDTSDFIRELLRFSLEKDDVLVLGNTMNILKTLAEDLVVYCYEDLPLLKKKELQKNLSLERPLIFQTALALLQNADTAETNSRLTEQILRVFKVYIVFIDMSIPEDRQVIDIVVAYIKNPQYAPCAIECLREYINNRNSAGEMYIPKTVYDAYETIVQIGESLFENTTIEQINQNIAQISPNVFSYLVKISTTISALILHMLSNTGIHGTKTTKNIKRGLGVIVKIAGINRKMTFESSFNYYREIVAFFYRHHQTEKYSSEYRMKNEHTANPLNYEYEVILLATDMVHNIPKPSEVLITMDDEGEIVSMTDQESEKIEMHEKMKHTFFQIAVLYYKSLTKMFYQKVLECVEQADDISPLMLNKACWSLGSISESAPEDEETVFLIDILRELLGYCESLVTKEARALVASNIMYIVRQYTRFIRRHWVFLKAVIKKLFDFMREPFAGVKDMASQTFLCIAKHSGSEIAYKQKDEKEAFIEYIIREQERIVAELAIHQTTIFYAGCCIVVQKVQPEEYRVVLSRRLAEHKMQEIVAFDIENTDEQQIKYFCRSIEVQKEIVRSLAAYSEERLAHIVPVLTKTCTYVVQTRKKSYELEYDSPLLYKRYGELVREVVTFFKISIECVDSTRFYETEIPKYAVAELLPTIFSESPEDDLHAEIDLAAELIRKCPEDENAAEFVISTFTIVFDTAVSYVMKHQDDPEAADYICALQRLIMAAGTKRSFEDLVYRYLIVPGPVPDLMRIDLIISLVEYMGISINPSISTAATGAAYSLLIRFSKMQNPVAFDTYSWKILENALSQTQRAEYVACLPNNAKIIAYTIEYALQVSEEAARKVRETIFKTTKTNPRVSDAMVLCYVDGLFRLYNDLPKIERYIDDFRIKLKNSATSADIDEEIRLLDTIADDE